MDLITENNPNLKITRSELKKLFIIAKAQIHFTFLDSFYDQIDGVSMGSPLAPILANTFMDYHEQKWLNEYKGNSPSHFRRYVNDIFAVFNNNDKAENFLPYLNIQHNNIKFTIEVEVDGKLPFSDVLVSIYTGVLNTSVYHKKTYTGLLTNYFSFCSLSYKIGPVRTLIDRTFKINNTWLSFESDVNNLTTTLRKKHVSTTRDKQTNIYLFKLKV